MSFFGRVIHRLDSVDSTNNYANQLIEHGLAVNGTVVIAYFQTGGRGQLGKHWLAEKGLNLTCSLVYFPANLSVDRIYLLNCWLSYALIQLLKRFNIDAKVKWPNDVMVGHRKIAGVLVEAVVEGLNVKSATLGIGLNVNQTDFTGINATSVRNETGKEVSVNEVMQHFCYLLNERSFSSDDERSLRTQYLNNMLGMYEEQLFEVNGERIKGKIHGISKEGHLEILVDGQHKRYSQGEIILVLPGAF
jgi:BirA family biotin operon repressor/biotin-[acetyl-CoA-carboxylase] ligase